MNAVLHNAINNKGVSMLKKTILGLIIITMAVIGHGQIAAAQPSALTYDKVFSPT